MIPDLRANNLTAYSAPALAGTTSFSGSLTPGSPAYFRPADYNSTSEGCGFTPSINTEPVFYSAQSFTVGTNGIYDVANTSNTFSSGDSFFALYEGSFNPASPLTNLLYVDDDNGASLMADINCPLSAGTTYILVTSPWASADTGDFTNTITGPGLITLLSVPAGMIEDLQTLVSGMGLAHGLTTALNSKLQDALDALAVDDSATACGSLGAFLNQVRAQTGKKLRPDQALQLADAAGNIRTQLGC